MLGITETNENFVRFYLCHVVCWVTSLLTTISFLSRVTRVLHFPCSLKMHIKFAWSIVWVGNEIKVPHIPRYTLCNMIQKQDTVKHLLYICYSHRLYLRLYVDASPKSREVMNLNASFWSLYDGDAVQKLLHTILEDSKFT